MLKGPEEQRVLFFRALGYFLEITTPPVWVRANSAA